MPIVKISLRFPTNAGTENQGTFMVCNLIRTVLSRVVIVRASASFRTIQLLAGDVPHRHDTVLKKPTNIVIVVRTKHNDDASHLCESLDPIQWPLQWSC